MTIGYPSRKSLSELTIDELLDVSDIILDKAEYMSKTCNIKELQDTVLSWHNVENELKEREHKMNKEQREALLDFMTDFNLALDRTGEHCKCIVNK